MSDMLVTLKREKEFNHVFQQGQSYVNRHFVLYVLPTGIKYKKVAFCAGKKLGKAVYRNRIRRRSKNAFQKISDRIKSGYSLIIIARLPVYKDSFTLLTESLLELLKRARVLKEDNK